MSRVYDNWERLVEATLDREELRRLALCPSFISDYSSSSFNSNYSLDFSSRFSFDYRRKGVQGARPGPVLDWMQRVRIAFDAARGLEYLHEKAQPSVIHYNIQSSNVLLFENYKAKIADFQPPPLKSFDSPYNVAPICSAHLAPEYIATGQLTEKSDVYSFGVVMLELLTGRKPIDHTMPRGQQSLIIWATPRLSEDKVKQCVDPRLKGVYHPKAVAKFAAIAALCVQYEPDFRPDMRFVVKALQPMLKLYPEI